jgi:DNA-binding IscR family transcriptional regulator
MKRTDIQKLLSINGYWTINKHLARTFGFTATALLQQLIELQCNNFPNGDFYQQQDNLAEKLGISEKILVSARKKLVETDLLIARRGHGAKYYYTVKLDNITEFFETDNMECSNTTKGNVRTLQKVPANIKKQKHKEIKHKELLEEVSSIDIDINKEDDIKGKIFFKIVERYPKNRIGNRQHVLKHFKKLSTQECKLSLVNLNRYLEHAGGYVKSLSNYVTEQCYSEAWLQAEETNKNKKTDINKGFDTKHIDTEF